MPAKSLVWEEIRWVSVGYGYSIFAQLTLRFHETSSYISSQRLHFILSVNLRV
ncbi:hypothetical protein B0J17DRAFT_299748 [Rhizoctonia solani]|nr:hypothetical protein B0J17DRAFT_299748 [Rhizoctonia solani]